MEGDRGTGTEKQPEIRESNQSHGVFVNFQPEQQRLQS